MGLRDSLPGQTSLPRMESRPGWIQSSLFILWRTAKYQKNVEQSEYHMLRKTLGMGMPLRLAMEKAAASKVGHLPCLSVASRASYEALTGQDFNIGFDDVFGKMENNEMITDSPFNVVNKYLDENKI